MSGFSIRLFGGPADGETFAVREEIVRSGRLLVPQRPEISPLIDDSGPLIPRYSVYDWDLTMNEHGEYRFRYSGVG